MSRQVILPADAVRVGAGICGTTKLHMDATAAGHFFRQANWLLN